MIRVMLFINYYFFFLIVTFLLNALNIFFYLFRSQK